MTKYTPSYSRSKAAKLLNRYDAMLNNNDLENTWKDEDEDNNGVPDGAEQEASGAKYDSHEESYTVETFWKDKPLGRTLSLRNKTGKTIVGGIATAGSTFLPEPLGGWVGSVANSLITIQTGVPMEFLDMSLLQMAITLIPIIAGLVVAYFFPTIKQNAVWTTIEQRLDDVSEEVAKAVDEDSEGGKKVTRNELKAIIGSALRKEDL